MRPEDGSRSIWMDIGLPRYAPLKGDAETDVVVVGAGIAGLSAAYELSQRGRSVLVVDRAAIGGRMTMRTTAHLSFEIDDYYYKLAKLRGEEAARRYFESQSAAVDRIEDICARENIGCDFARVDLFLVGAGESGDEIIGKERDAAQQISFPGVERSEPPEGFSGPTLRFPNQARFHPTKYLRGLAAALEQRGVRLCEDTTVRDVEEKDGGVIAELDGGRRISAKFAVVATNSPINDLVAIHTKQAPYRTYAFAAPIAKGAPDALIWDTEEPYHYVRLLPGERTDLLIVGGEDHKTGEANDGKERVARLFAWAKARFPSLGEPVAAWSGQVYEPIDYAPHLGVNPGDSRVFVITGDSGEGLTTGVAGALLIADLIGKGASPWTEVYDPSRKVLAAAGRFVMENKDAVAGLAERLTPGELSGFDELSPGEGGLVRAHGRKLAAYKDESGVLNVFSAACSHLGCVVHFNAFERSWDCPCHGSQFSVDGEAVAGPARRPLKAARESAAHAAE